MPLFGLGLSNTMIKSTRLQMPTFSRLKLILTSPGGGPHRRKPVVPRQTLPHFNTGHSLVIPAIPVIQRFLWYPHQDPNAKHQGPAGSPTSALALVSSFPARGPAPVLAAPVGRSSHHPRYATFYNYLGSSSLRFMEMELESEAQLLNVLPPPIRRHQAQNYTFGTSVVDTLGQIDVGQGASTHFRYQQQATPVGPYQHHLIRPRTHTITPRQVIAHKCYSRLFNLLTIRLDYCIGLCMSFCVIGISWCFVLVGL